MPKIPAPMMEEAERQKRVSAFRLGVYAQGCVIEREWRVHNPVFDKRGEKTTTKFVIRPVATEDEAKYVASELEKAVKEEFRA